MVTGTSDIRLIFDRHAVSLATNPVSLFFFMRSLSGNQNTHERNPTLECLRLGPD